MSDPRIAGSAIALVLAIGITTVGVTWAVDSTPPRLERTSVAVLFDAVHLTPGVPVSRCAEIVPRGAGLVALDLDGQAEGTLAPAARLRVERGVAGQVVAANCSGFVPVTTVHDGPLDTLPSAAAPATAAVAIPADRPIAYRATLSLPAASAGETRFGLRITGHFAESSTSPDAHRPPGDQPPGDQPPAEPPAAPCTQLQTGQRIERASHGGGLRVTVRTPQALPVQRLRPLPVYVTARGGTRPRVSAGRYRAPLRRTPGGRWLGHVPIAALQRSRSVRVVAGREVVTVPVRTRPCGVRLRSFLRQDGTIDLRIDAAQPLTGLRLRLPAGLGRPSGGRLRVGAIDEWGRARASHGRLGARGREPTARLPLVTISGRTVEVLDVPDGVHTLSLRLAVRDVDRLRASVCRSTHRTTGHVAIRDVDRERRDAVRSPLRLIGDRCP